MVSCYFDLGVYVWSCSVGLLLCLIVLGLFLGLNVFAGALRVCLLFGAVLGSLL